MASTYTLILGNKNYSSWSLRGWLALKQTGARFEEVLVPLSQPGTREAILRHSPSGRVPALRDGELVIWDSLAIGEYLAEKHPAAGLWPAEAPLRAIARSVAAEMHSGFAALRTALPFNARRTPSPLARTPEVEADVARIVEVWNDCRARYGAGGPFLFGKPTLADVMYAPVVGRFHVYGVPLAGAAAQYADAVLALPAMKEWFAAARVEPYTEAKYER